MADEYVRIICTYIARTSRSVKIRVGKSECWIARSCINGIDEPQVETANHGDELELRIFAWLAKKENLE